jgi:hypothetical protein
MKSLFQIIFFCFLTSISFGQTSELSSLLYMTDEQNRAWLTTLKLQDKESKWLMISDRYFRQSNSMKSIDRGNDNVPVLIINGVSLLITDSLSADSSNQLLTLLTKDKIENIKVLDKEPEGLYVNKGFTGVILVNLNDKKTNKRLQRIKIE